MIQTPTHATLPKACLRALVDTLLRLHGTKLPTYFSLRDRVSYLLHGLEPSLVKVAAEILRPGDKVVDIGANVGFLSRQFASQVGRTGHVFAFEPDPVTFDYLVYNTRRLPQVSSSQLAMSDRIDRMTFYLHPISGMSNSLVNAWDNARSMEVDTSTLDAWTREVAPGPIRLIKIDVEGAELLVLRGMRDLMQAPNSPQIILEFCPKNLGGSEVEEAIFDLMAECGQLVYLVGWPGDLKRVGSAAEVRCHLNINGYANLLARRE
jgi:FkbM family methyltransferase